jgi:hypothetical protein
MRNLLASTLTLGMLGGMVLPADAHPPGEGPAPPSTQTSTPSSTQASTPGSAGTQSVGSRGGSDYAPNPAQGAGRPDYTNSGNLRDTGGKVREPIGATSADRTAVPELLIDAWSRPAENNQAILNNRAIWEANATLNKLETLRVLPDGERARANELARQESGGQFKTAIELLAEIKRQEANAVEARQKYEQAKKAFEDPNASPDQMASADSRKKLYEQDIIKAETAADKAKRASDVVVGKLKEEATQKLNDAVKRNTNLSKQAGQTAPGAAPPIK